MITLAITNYNRSNLTIESFERVINNPLISEIVIVDDKSTESIFQDLTEKIKNINNSKIKLFRNSENIKAFSNKIESVKKSSNEWVIVFDSDNILTEDYLYSIPQKLESNFYYLPSHAMCASNYLDYNKFANTVIDKNDFKNLVSSEDIITHCLLNTGNCLVNRNTFLEAINCEPYLLNCYAADCVYLIYLAFKNTRDFKLKVVDNMKYYHRINSKNYGNEQTSYYEENSIQSEKFVSYLKNHLTKTL